MKSKWPIGVFASIDAGLGAKLEVARELGVSTIQLHAPGEASRTAARARQFLATLADLGITADAQTGQLDSSASTLSNALTSSLSGVEALLAGPNGIATQINNLVTQYTQSGGILSIVNSGLQTGLSNIATQQAALNAQLAAYSATLTTQYNAMDAAVAALKETQTYLTAEFNPNSSSSSSSANSSLSAGNTST